MGENNKIERADIGSIGLIKETKDGRIVQLAMTEEQSKIIQILVAKMSKHKPLIQLGKEYDLFTKKQ